MTDTKMRMAFYILSTMNIPPLAKILIQDS